MQTDLRRLIAALLVFFPWGGGAAAQSTESDDWTHQKCDLYNVAWQDVQSSYDLSGASERFLEKHQNFINLGCPEDMRVCAISPKEIELANLLTILSMNEGMASTFVPFGCPE